MRDDIYAEIEQERLKQDPQVGLECDVYSSEVWWFMIQRQRWELGPMRDRLVQVAALAVEAIESLDRKAKSEGMSGAASDTPQAKNSCNKHVDCAAADDKTKENDKPYHCHDDCCEDCFGS